MSWGLIAAFASSVTWAVGSSVYAKLSREFPGITINLTRTLVGLPLFGIAAVITLGPHFGAGLVELHSSHLFWLFISMLCSYAVGDILFFRSTRSLGIPGALAIASAYPLWTALASIATGTEALSFPRLGGLVVTLAGIITVILNEPPRGVSSKKPEGVRPPLWEGLALASIASILWAINSYAVSKGGQNVSPMLANVVRMVFGFFLTATMGGLLLRRPGTPVPFQPLIIPWKKLRPWLWAFVIEVFGGSFFFLYGLAHCPLSVGPILTSLAPILSVPVALVIGSEKFSFFRTLGVCLAVAGLAILVSN